MKSMIDLWRVLANELARWCYTSTTLDIKTVESRVKNEGMSFLTMTLPSFGKDFERCLELGHMDDSMFLGFKRRGGLPLFLGGFLRQVFDASSGVLLDEPNKDSILAIRQLTLLFAKILHPCSNSRERGAFEGFVQIETELREWEANNTSFDYSNFRRVSRLLFADVFAKMDEICFVGDLYPKHGPGATADRIYGNRKFDQMKWSTRLEDIGLHYGDFCLPNWRYHNRQASVEVLDPGNEVPVKVISVPKTLKAPRIIAIEPAYMQYMQQAVLFELIELLETEGMKGSAFHNLGSHFLGFTDQIPNRDLACRGSVGGSLATLDLSEASDRVSNSHVIELLHGFPSFLEVVQAVRSTKANVPALGLSIYDLRKFASMGSALCFPFEAMVFTTAIFLGIEQKLGHQLDRQSILDYRGKVRVYGDDLIIPVDCVDAVLDSLARLGFKVNINKSFWNGKFRESCGGDYYAGEWVTPIRWRRDFPQSRRDVSEVISLVETRNLFYLSGFWETAGWLDEKIREILTYFPIVEPTSPALGRTSISFQYEAERMCDIFHAPRVRAWKIKSKLPANSASGEGSLLKCLDPRRGDKPFEDPRHLERSGRPSDVGINLRWMQPF
jgi:hypothetical protein